MKRTKFKTGILAVVFCSLTFLFSGDGNSIYADEILTDTELPVGRFSFEEKTEEADDEDYESVEEYSVRIELKSSFCCGIWIARAACSCCEP